MKTATMTAFAMLSGMDAFVRLKAAMHQLDETLGAAATPA